MNSLLESGVSIINLQTIIERKDEIIAKSCEQYQKQLANVFGSSEGLFANAAFNLQVDDIIRSAEFEFNKRVGSQESEMFSMDLIKEQNDLIVSLLVEKEKVRPVPRIIIKGIIGDA